MTLPDYSRNGFYDPGQTYRGLSNNYGTPVTYQQIGKDLGYPGNILYQNYGTETNPQGVYRAGLAKMGLGGMGTRARVAQGLFPQVWQGYQAAKANSNTELFFPEFLDQSRVGDIFNSLSYEQQGLDPGRFGQRKYQWSMRG